VVRLAAMIPFAAALAACGSQSTPKPPDQLEALLVKAREDSALARSVAAAHADLAPSVMAIADSRGQHADALRREIDRVNPPTPKPSSSTTPPPAPPAPESSGDAKAALIGSLRAAQGQAANLVPVVAPYRAGLLGSIAASCSSLVEVLG
jgi:hypothetical protein